MAKRRPKKEFDKFLNGTICQVTLAAALRRSGTYEQEVEDSRKRKFRTNLRKCLREISVQYSSPVTEDIHCENIKKIQDLAASGFEDILAGGKIRIGVAQKALNLYLKLYWSIARIPTPPHCPIDSRILVKLPGEDWGNWTEINHMSTYKKIINAIRREATNEGLSIAEWELKKYGSGATD
jgi:hypothetical protein